MIRDKFKDRDYFDSCIDKRTKLVEDNLIKYNNNLLKPERVSSVINFTIGLIKNTIIAKYSRGDDMFTQEVHNDYKKMIALMYENWGEDMGKLKVSQKGKEVIILDQYTFSSYVGILETLSLGILLNVPNNDKKLLTEFIDRDSVKDFLFEFLNGFYDKERKAINEESYKDFFYVNERLGRLKTIIKESDKLISQKELQYFLEKEWYESFKDTPLYNQHLNPHNTYVGYWCFVAAAIVKIKGLDDSSFRDNPYYPKDLVIVK